MILGHHLYLAYVTSSAACRLRHYGGEIVGAVKAEEQDARDAVTACLVEVRPHLRNSAPSTISP